MQAETTAKIDIIKTAIDLLCKHVKYDDAKAKLAIMSNMMMPRQSLPALKRLFLMVISGMIRPARKKPCAKKTVLNVSWQLLMRFN